MNEKRWKEEYRKLQEDATPDLWDRIEGRLEARPERGREAAQEVRGMQESGDRQETSGLQDADSAGKTGWMRLQRRYGYGLTAAAAAIAITVGLNVVRNTGSMAPEMAARPAATEAAETTAAASAAGKVTMESEAMPAALADGVLTWQQLSLGTHNALSVPEGAVTVPEDTWYFSEAILADTDLLCGAVVQNVSFAYDSSGNASKVVYDLTIDEIYYAEDYVASKETIQVQSPIVKTEGDEAFLLYQLQRSGTYLLPLKQQEGAWELLYPFAPQVQVLKEGGYLFHSGYVSLMDSQTSVVIGQQEAANDYYYDRMLFRDDDGFLSDFLSLVEP